MYWHVYHSINLKICMKLNYYFVCEEMQTVTNRFFYRGTTRSRLASKYIASKD